MAALTRNGPRAGASPALTEAEKAERARAQRPKSPKTAGIDTVGALGAAVGALAVTTAVAPYPAGYGARRQTV